MVDDDFQCPQPARRTKSGCGIAVLSLLPPSSPSFTSLSYKYPLKLIYRVPKTALESVEGDQAVQPVHLYLLGYGGGLLPGDHISVNIHLKERTRMVITTPQGSTKIYKTEAQKHGRYGSGQLKGEAGSDASGQDARGMSRQTLDVRIEKSAGLCYLPDPTAPFKDSRYEQTQRFFISEKASLCVLDWVTQGRAARGEDWSFDAWTGRNEIWTADSPEGSKPKLLLRDLLALERAADLPIKNRTGPHGIVGTVIFYGKLFAPLSKFFVHTFNTQPRIRRTPASTPETVMWTAARVRGSFVVVKFGAPDFDTAQQWLGGLLREGESVEREFGEEALESFGR